ncbi:MAG TPA: hypothetical protein ENH82_17960, partial [bacterium]|nr:hypothetical protein [bacterium]
MKRLIIRFLPFLLIICHAQVFAQQSRPYPENFDPEYIPPLSPSLNKIAVTPLSLPFFDDMESGENGWSKEGFEHLITNPQNYEVLNPTINPFMVTLPDEGYLPNAHSGSASWWYGEDITGTFIGSDFDPDQGEMTGGTSMYYNTGFLVTPPFQFPANNTIFLSFWSWWEIEGVDVDTYDMMYVEISTDNGSSFDLLGTLNPINDVDGESYIPFSSKGLGQVGEWQKHLFDLSMYSGNDVIIRFRFDTIDALFNGFRGWFIDDVAVFAGTAEAPVITSINPTVGVPETIVHIWGENFINGVVVKFGDTIVESALIGYDYITAMVPWSLNYFELLDITVTNIDGQSYTLPEAFMVTDTMPPSITEIYPTETYFNESILVTIYGSYFDDNAIGYIENIPLVDQSVGSSSQIVGYVPYGLWVGSHNVKVVNSDGQTDLLVNSFAVLQLPGPVVTDLTIYPNPTMGSETVSIDAVVSTNQAAKIAPFEKVEYTEREISFSKLGAGKIAKISTIEVGNSLVTAFISDENLDWESMGEFYFTTADGKTLLYYDFTGTGFIRIDGISYRFGGSDGTWTTPLYASTDQVIGVWEIFNISVSFTLTIVQSTTTGQYDTFKIHYNVKNNGTVSHEIGFFKMLDTMINGNDAAPVSAGDGYNLNEREFTSVNMPNFWQAYEESPSQTSDKLISQGTLYGGGAIKPDRFVIAGWYNLIDVTWDYTPYGEYSDSGVAMWWYPVNVSPGSTKDFSTLYGLGTVDTVVGDMTLSLTAESSLMVIDNTLTPNPFQVTAIVTNNSGVTASDVQIGISLPAGLSLNIGETYVKTIGTLGNGETGQVTWWIVATEQAEDMSYTYSLTASSSTTGISDVTNTKSIFVPSVSFGPYVT